jgi:hypothetical protein
LAGTVPTFRQPSPTFFQEGADLGQAAADAGQPLDGLLGLAGVARGVLDEVVFEGLLMLVQLARLALPVEPTSPVEPALLELVEVALHGARRDIGQFGDVGVNEALALQPQDLHLALDSWVRVVVPVVADFRQHFRAEGEHAHGCLSASDQRASNHAVRIQLSSGNSANLNRGEYND